MFPFRKKPPTKTKVQVAKKAVAEAAHAVLDIVPTDAIEEKFDDLKKSTVAVALHAAQVAHHASEVASHKLEELQQAAATFGNHASEAAHRAADAADRTSDSAHAAGEGAVAAASAKALAAKEAALAARESLQERAGTLLESAVALKTSFQDRVSHDVEAGQDKVEDAKTAAHAAKSAAQEAAKEATKRGADKLGAATDAAKAKFAGKKAEAEERIAAIEVPDLPRVKNGAIQVEYSESGAKWGWILLGLAAGAILVLFLAPTAGRRSRGAIKGRLDKVADGAVDAATATADKVVDIAHRVEGIAHKVETKLIADGETDDDSIIADRVRTVLGHQEAAKAIERINVDCAGGVITLRGPIVDEATQDTIIAAVKLVPGVKDVISDFLLDEPVDPATSVV